MLHIHPVLHPGREGLGLRAEEELRCYDFLDALGVSYLRVDHDRADTMEDCREVEALLGAPICKNLLLTNRQQTEFYLLLMPGDKPFKTKYLSAQIGSARLSFAGEEALSRFLGVRPGSASLLGLLNDREGRVQLLLDEELLGDGLFACHPCRNTSTLRMSREALLDVVLPALGHPPRRVQLPREPE